MKNQKPILRSCFNRNIMLAIHSGITQKFDNEKEFCSEAGIDASDFSRLRSGVDDPSLDSVGKMLEILGIEVVLFVPRKFKVL